MRYLLDMISHKCNIIKNGAISPFVGVALFFWISLRVSYPKIPGTATDSGPAQDFESLKMCGVFFMAGESARIRRT